ncbi:hypothetical protein LTR95_013969 [Oleoguttula sp. CCFEE 5521]
MTHHQWPIPSGSSPAQDPPTPDYDPSTPAYSPPSSISVRDTPKCLKRKRSECDYGKILEVRVGHQSASKTFCVHTDAICAKSKFFAAATSRRWATDSKKPIRLPHEYPKTFAAYLDWVYFNEIDIDTSQLMYGDAASRYVLADTLDDVQARNKVTDKLLDAWMEGVLPNAACVELLFEHSPPSCKLRLLMIHAHIARICPRWLEREAKCFPPAFFQQLALESLKRTDIRRAEDIPKIGVSRSRL